MNKKYYLFAATLLLAIGVAFTSCRKDNDTVEAEMVALSEDDAAADDIFSDMANQADTHGGFTKNNFEKDNCKPEVTKTVDAATNSRHIELDFGQDGCEGYYGRIRKGKIIIDQQGLMINAESVRTITLENFSIDGYAVEGTRTITSNGINSDGFRQVTIKLTDGKIITPEGKIITRTSERVREKIAGEDTPFKLRDDQFRISGTASGINRNGKAYTATISAPLIFDMGCKYKLTQGIIDITAGENTLSIDYGNGECDNEAILTVNGNSKKIRVRRH